MVDTIKGGKHRNLVDAGDVVVLGKVTTYMGSLACGWGSLGLGMKAR